MFILLLLLIYTIHYINYIKVCYFSLYKHELFLVRFFANKTNIETRVISGIKELILFDVQSSFGKRVLKNKEEILKKILLEKKM